MRENEVLRRLAAGRLKRRETMYRCKAAGYLRERPDSVDDAVQDLLMLDHQRSASIPDDRHRFVRCWNLWLMQEHRRRAKEERTAEAVTTYGELKRIRIRDIHRGSDGKPVPVLANGLLHRNPTTPDKYAEYC